MAFEDDEIKHSMVRENIRKECYPRARIIVKTELNSSNRNGAIATLPIPIVNCNFDIINWSLTEIFKLDWKI